MVNNMVLLTLLYTLILSLLAVSISWLLLLTIGSWLYKPQRDPSAPLLKLGVIIPAHNEELGIQTTIEAIRECDYPQELLTIMVIADNCSDRTADIARQSGVIVVERTNPEQIGKGQALDWFLTTKKDLYQNLEAVSFVDADVTPDTNMFKELSAALSSPSTKAVQGFNGVANPLDNWRTALNTAAFNVFNHLRMAGNNKLFGTSMLKGLGMAFTTDVLLKHGWPAHSVVEDVEFSLVLLDDNITIQYNPYAVITSEMATSRKQADSQRLRWEGGRFRLATKIVPQLIAKLLNRHFQYLHFIMDLVIPPLAILVVLLICAFFLALTLFPQSLPLVIGLMVSIIFYIASGQLQRKAGIRLWLYLFTSPAFILWKLFVYIKMIFLQKKLAWTRTTRKTEM